MTPEEEKQQALLAALTLERFGGPPRLTPFTDHLTPAEHERIRQRLLELADLPHDEEDPA